MTNQKQMVVLTGGSCSGKTTTIEQLALLGFETVTEAAIDVIREMNKELGLAGQRQWRSENQGQFIELIARRQALFELNAIENGTAKHCFLDRGLPDNLAYSQAAGCEPSKVVRHLIAARRYDHVFVLETLSNFHPRWETGRDGDASHSRATMKLLIKAYSDLGYHPVVIPEMSVRDRVHFILSSLALG